MRRNPTYALVAAGLVLCLPTALAGKPPPTATVLVDCTDPDPTKHGSINGALETPAGELIIEIRGMCREKVEVERKNVTLRGADPSSDGVSGPVLDWDDPNDRALVTVRGGVKGVRFENLRFTGSVRRGLEVREEAWIEVANCRLSGNWRGLQASNGSNAVVTDTEIKDNTHWQVVALANAWVTCNGCTISAPSANGLLSVSTGRMELSDSSVDVSGFLGAVARLNGYIWAVDTDLAAGSWAVYATDQSEVMIQREDAESPPEISGQIVADSKSMVWLESVTQTVNTSINHIGGDSNLTLVDGVLVGQTYLTRFSNGTAEGGSALGDLICDRGADFFCDAGVTKNSSSCGLCP